MSNPKDCIHCYDYEDMGCKMPVCEFDFPSINTPKCNGCSKFIKRDLVQVVRCKDCKFYLYSEEMCGLLNTRLHFYETDNVWTRDCFCSWGERRKEETN